jgi:carbamoyltransferase
VGSLTDRPTYVLGTGLSHDGSVCLLKDGEIVLGIEKERLTRVKHDGGNDRVAMEYVLGHAGITLDDVALVVQNENFGMFRAGHTTYGGGLRALKADTNVVTISHHLAHAYSAFGGCPFEDTAVLVIDGCGNAYPDCIDVRQQVTLGDIPGDLEHLYFEKDSYYLSEGNLLSPTTKDFSEWGEKGWPVTPPSTLHSIGGVYRAFSTYVFGGFDDSGKLMGLAPYGQAGRFSDPIFDLRDGRVFVVSETLHGFVSPAANHDELKQRFQYYADIAYWVQKEVERALLYVVRDRYGRGPSPNLAYAGGVALNAVANRRILTETDFERLYIQPAAGDDGLAIGCAYYGWLEVLGRERVRPSGSTCLGAAYSPSRIQRALAAVEQAVEVDADADVVEATAQQLADGKIVAWFAEGSEFGPRALGHRSILGHPGKAGLRDRINERVKFREDFRPFAPSVLLDDAPMYFDCDGHESPYMVLVFDVRPEWRDALINVVHEDGTSRLHTVTDEQDPRYARLLRAFERRTGLPVLLNTSLNKRGMPIVETPEEALAFFLECDLDCLVLGDVLVTKRAAVGDRAVGGVLGGIREPGSDDIPLIGRRVTSVSLTHELVPDPGRGTRRSAERVLLCFSDSAETLELAPDAFKLLQLCDGTRTYAEISRQVPVAIGYLLEFASILSEHRILEHLDPGITSTTSTGATSRPPARRGPAA